ncbi:MAG: ATP-binding protein, partial [Candidatus Saccharimonadales bacterium]
PLWVLAALFGAVAGVASFTLVALSIVIFGLYLWYFGSVSVSDWITYGATIVLPLLISVSIWVRRFRAEGASDKTVTALAKELNQESSKSSIIINAIADGVLLVDAKGTIQLINPAAEQIIGWGSEDATKLDYRSVLKIIDSKDEIIDPSLDPISQSLLSNQSVISDKYGIRTISGKHLLASIMVSPLGAANTGVIVVFRDITAQRAEEREQAEFISTASHEMRTPVAAIEGYIGLSLNPQTAVIDEKARSYLLKAQDSAKNLGKLFQDLLDISRIEDGRLTSNPSMVEVSSFVQNNLDDFVTLASQKSINLAFAPKNTANPVAPIYYANVDINHLKEVLTNLISNAIKYTKQGSVTVDVTGDSEHVFVSVKDSGIGIPAEDIPHLFQKFYRVDNTDTREIGGTGLGLFLARRLVESMTGRLTVSSIYGEGSTFTIELPRVEKEPEALAAPTTVTAENTTLETKL